MTGKTDECYIPSNGFVKLSTPLLIVSKSICKIKIVNKSGTGFLIKLKKNKIPFYCLMTCEHVIEKEYCNSQTTIDFDLSFNYEREKRKISLNKGKRYIKDFLNLKIDGIIIEILPSDEIPQEYFLSPNLDYINGYQQFIHKKIFILQYPKNNDLSYSEGIIESNLKDFEFIHKASTDQGSSGSPIFLDKTEEVIGIHKGGNKKKYKNYGKYIGPIINDLEPQNKPEIGLIIKDVQISSSDDFKPKDKIDNKKMINLIILIFL